MFTFKLFNYDNAPINLKNKFKFNIDLNNSYDLRNINQLQTSRVSGFNKNGSNMYAFFFSTFIYKFCIEDLFSFYRQPTIIDNLILESSIH